MKAKESKVAYESVWKNGSRTCTVRATKLKGDKTAVFTFSGFNPFPCFYMQSTYACVAKWLQENGWKNGNKFSVTHTEDVINTETGEIISHHVTTRTYVQSRPVKEKSVRQLIEEGDKIHAISRYRKETGCSISDALDYVNNVMYGNIALKAN